MKKSPKLIYVVSSILVIVVFGFIFINWHKQQANGIKMAPLKSNNISGPIVVKYPEAINKGFGDLTITPTVEGRVEIVDNYVIFWPRFGYGFLDNAEYLVGATDYRSINGEVYENVSFSFSVNRNTANKPLQTEVTELYGTPEEPEESDPFLRLMPYRRAYRFIVTFEGTPNDNNELAKENGVVTIKTLVNQGRHDSLKDYLGFVKDARQEALGWIKEQGVDPNTLTIVYTPTDHDVLNLSFNTSN